MSALLIASRCHVRYSRLMESNGASATKQVAGARGANDSRVWRRVRAAARQVRPRPGARDTRAGDSGATLSAREADYVTAGRALGASNARIITHYVLPNIAAPLIVQGSLLFAGAIVTEAGLSFLGGGVQPPRPGWGVDLQFGYQYMEINPILAFAPGGAIFITVLACNFFGDALRVALDPQLSRHS